MFNEFPRGWGYSSEFLVGVCRPVLQILTLFQTKICLFHTRFQTWPLKSIPVFRPNVAGTNFPTGFVVAYLKGQFHAIEPYSKRLKNAFASTETTKWCSSFVNKNHISALKPFLAIFFQVWTRCIPKIAKNFV